MLASFHGGGIDMGIEEADSCSGNSGDGYDGSGAIITDLISNGAGIHAQTDRTGKDFNHMSHKMLQFHVESFIFCM